MLFNKIKSKLGRIKTSIKAIAKLLSSIHNGNELNELIKRLSELDHGNSSDWLRKDIERYTKNGRF